MSKKLIAEALGTLILVLFGCGAAVIGQKVVGADGVMIGIAVAAFVAIAKTLPGALSYCFAEGLLAQSTMQKTGYAFLNMELNIENPAFAGDTIHVECEVIEARLSASRPGRGLVRTRNKVVKQDGVVVLTYTPLRMVKCRNQPGSGA